MTFKGKHIVVVGGASGIGQGIAAAALEQGADVTIAGRTAASLSSAAKLFDGPVRTVRLDLGDAACAAQGFAEIGLYDHLVITAADLTYAPLVDMEVEAISRMLEAKFWGPVNAVKHGLSTLQPGGSILFFSGLAANRPGKGTSIVAALNAGIEGFTRALAVELAPIRINAISPGVTPTPGWDFMPADQRDAFFESLANVLPAGRVGKPSDIADAALMILSNGFITGEVLQVNGGGHLV